MKKKKTVKITVAEDEAFFIYSFYQGRAVAFLRELQDLTVRDVSIISQNMSILSSLLSDDQKEELAKVKKVLESINLQENHEDMINILEKAESDIIALAHPDPKPHPLDDDLPPTSQYFNEDGTAK